MKKLLVFVITLLLLCGCAEGGKTVDMVDTAETGKPVPEAPSETVPVAPEEAPKLPEEAPETLISIPFEPVDVQIEPSSTIKTEPDTLTVVSGSHSVQLRYGTCSWWYENGDGTGSGLEACGVHPLDTYEHCPVLSMDGDLAYLAFGAEAADRITIRCWPVSEWGNWEAEAEMIPVENLQFRLKETGCVYEICAQWDSAETWGGSASYVFCTSPLGLLLHAEAVTERGMTLVYEQSGGTPTGMLETGYDFWLEVNEDGVWRKLETTGSEFAWEDMAYSIALNDETRMEIDWEGIYGRLPAGRYRLGKEITDFRGPGDYDTYRIYSDNFAIEWADLH